jgi:hypothetical protein
MKFYSFQLGDLTTFQLNAMGFAILMTLLCVVLFLGISVFWIPQVTSKDVLRSFLLIKNRLRSVVETVSLEGSCNGPPGFSKFDFQPSQNIYCVINN